MYDDNCDDRDDDTEAIETWVTDQMLAEASYLDHLAGKIKTYEDALEDAQTLRRYLWDVDPMADEVYRDGKPCNFTERSLDDYRKWLREGWAVDGYREWLKAERDRESDARQADERYQQLIERIRGTSIGTNAVEEGGGSGI